MRRAGAHGSHFGPRERCARTRVRGVAERFGGGAGRAGWYGRVRDGAVRAGATPLRWRRSLGRCRSCCRGHPLVAAPTATNHARKPVGSLLARSARLAGCSNGRRAHERSVTTPLRMERWSNRTLFEWNAVRMERCLNGTLFEWRRREWATTPAPIADTAHLQVALALPTNPNPQGMWGHVKQ